MSTRNTSHESSPSRGATTTPRTSPSAGRDPHALPARVAHTPVRDLRNHQQAVAARVPDRHCDLVGVREERQRATAARALHGRDRRAQDVGADLGPDRLGLAPHDRLHRFLVPRPSGGEKQLGK
jgi:hypothetical protein